MLHISMCKWGELFLSCWLFFSFLFFLLPCFLWIIVLHLRKQGSSLSTPLPFTISTAGIYYLPPFVMLWIILALGIEWYHIFVSTNILKQRQILKIPGILLFTSCHSSWSNTEQWCLLKKKGDDQRDTAFHFPATLSFRLALAQRGANRYSNNKTNTKHCIAKSSS